MIPKKLKIQGIYSYQKLQEIDFEKLTSSQIFGVFGSVGSGKSTLLEAISFALYGKTERLGSRDNLGYNMMNLKSNNILIDFEFENYDDKTYRFIIEGKRNSNKFNNVKTFSRRAFLYENKTWKPLKKTIANDIVGLSYENFRRTIIIPQGKFQEFLRLKDSERTEMLKEIFNLYKYDYSKQIGFLFNENANKKEFVMGKLSNYEKVYKDDLIKIKKKLKKINKLYIEKVEVLNYLKQKKDNLSLLKKEFEYLKIKKKEFDVVLSNKKNVLDKENTLKKIELARVEFESIINIIEKQNKEIVDIDNKLKKLVDNIIIIKKELKDNRNKLKDLKIKEKEIPNIEIKISDLELILEINNNKKIETKLKERLNKAKVFFDEFNKEILDIKIYKEKIKKEIESITESNKGSSFEEFTKLTLLFNDYKYLTDYKKNKIDEVKRLRNSFYNEVLKNNFDSSITLDNSSLIVDKELISIRCLISDLEVEHKNQVYKIQKLEVDKKLESWVEELTNEKPCPLCGSKNHPKIINVDSVKKHLDKEKNKLQLIQNKIKERNLQLNKLNEFYKVTKIYKSNLDIVNKDIKEADKKIQDKAKFFINSKYKIDEKPKLDEDFNKFKVYKKKIDDLNITYKNINEKLEQKTKQKEELISKYEDIQNKYNEINISIKTIVKQLKILSEKDFENNLEIEKTLFKYRKEITETKSLLLKLENIEIEKSKHYAVADENINNFTKNIEKQKIELNKNIEEFSLRLKKSGFKTENEIKTILKLNVNIEKLRKEISDYKIKESTLKTIIKEKELLLEKQSFDNDVFENIKNEITVLDKEVKEINEHRVELKAKHNKLKQDLKAKKTLTKDLKEIEKREENINVLKNLFKGNGFVNYISSVYLNNLCISANSKFFNLTKQQLKLEISDKNSFIVRDYLNEGKTRSVKTLSGGQMFQASLSLALALAESVQGLSKSKQNFFFLDEGFGSQDKESLQIVFNTLKLLRKENRVVGVISHVEELQQEISTYLSIVNHKEKGSIISNSWE